MKNKLQLNSILSALDSKNREYYENLTQEEQKEIQPYLLLRYMAFVKGSPELCKWYLHASNEFVNKGFWNIPSKHKKFMWNQLCDISPGMGKKYHQWVPINKQKKNKKIEVLERIYPEYGYDELKVLDKKYTNNDVRKLLKERGWTDEEIKRSL